MNLPSKRSFLGALTSTLAVALMTLSAPLVHAQAQAQQSAKRQQFIYILRVANKFHEQSSWTDKENAIVGRHFSRLAAATQAGQVVLAGRSNEPLDKTFGVVIFEADNEAAARQFMNADPAVEAGVMTATLHPYVIALQRKP